VDGARSALPTALAFVAVVALLDLVVVAGLVQRSTEAWLFARAQSAAATELIAAPLSVTGCP
jgi:hypothetical protein